MDLWLSKLILKLAGGLQKSFTGDSLHLLGKDCNLINLIYQCFLTIGARFERKPKPTTPVSGIELVSFSSLLKSVSLLHVEMQPENSLQWVCL